MQRQHYEAVLERPMAEAFSMLVNVLARGRWRTQLMLEPPERLPGPGMRYEQQRGSVLRRGRVVECIRPVSVTLQETLHDPPCRVELKLRWGLEPAERGSRVRLRASFELHGAAALRRRHWDERIGAHCDGMMQALKRALAAQAQEAGSSVSGQNSGSSSITAANVTSDNGRPAFR